MTTKGFIELEVHNHQILHGFDDNNKEIIEEVVVNKPTRKFISIERIQSISEQYVLTSYGFDRLIYWEYEGSYDELIEKINAAQTI